MKIYYVTCVRWTNFSREPSIITRIGETRNEVVIYLCERMKMVLGPSRYPEYVTMLGECIDDLNHNRIEPGEVEEFCRNNFRDFDNEQNVFIIGEITPK